MQTYARELLRALPAAVDAEVVAVVQADAVGELPPGVGSRTRRPSDGMRRAIESLRSVGPAGLVHGLDVDLPWRLPPLAVTTVHDLAVFDMPSAVSRRKAAGERYLVRRSVSRADAVIAVSSFTAERVKALFGRESVVIHEAPAPHLAPPPAEEIARVERAYDLPQRFVLHVGTVEPRKDVGTLAAACRLADVPLMLVGALSLPVPSGARALGWVPRDDLAPLYGAATLVAYPSRYEGFGLPPLEAMTCGAPVVATASTSLPEVLGEAAELVPVGDADRLGQAIRDLMRDEDRRAALARAGMVHSGSFSWKRAAAETADVYRGLGLDV